MSAVDRRREAARVLRLAAATAAYAAGQVGGGRVGPQAARQAVAESAGELAVLAGVLRELARPEPGWRQAMAVELAAEGLSQRAIAARLGCSKRSVWEYLRRDRLHGG